MCRCAGRRSIERVGKKQLLCLGEADAAAIEGYPLFGGEPARMVCRAAQFAFLWGFQTC